jgi:hypothetical protein
MHVKNKTKPRKQQNVSDYLNCRTRKVFSPVPVRIWYVAGWRLGDVIRMVAAAEFEGSRKADVAACSPQTEFPRVGAQKYI